MSLGIKDNNPYSVVNPTIPTGLIVKAKQTDYPIQLFSNELFAHLQSLQEYKENFIKDVISRSKATNPNLKLINQQPKMSPQKTRHSMVTFLFQLATVCKITNGIFFHAVRLYDRYSSKRIVLQEQSKLVVATCLWLSAKSWGGCDHIINERVVPTGGRFMGPGQRARIPKLSELVYYCGGRQFFNESMFCQMERHILNTLGWEVCVPTINDLVLNIDENCLVQYECYKRALSPNKQTYDSEIKKINSKIELINLKTFMIDLCAWQLELLEFQLYEVSNGILKVINKFSDHNEEIFMTPMSKSDGETSVNINTENKIISILVEAIIKTPCCLMDIYDRKAGIKPFYNKVREFQATQLLQQQASAVLSAKKASVVSKTLNLNKTPSEMSAYSSPSSVHTMTFDDISLDNDEDDDDRSPHEYLSRFTPIRKPSSTNSIFSSGSSGKTTPLTPRHIMTFGKITGSSSPLVKSLNMIPKRHEDHRTVTNPKFIVNDSFNRSKEVSVDNNNTKIA